MTWSLSTFIFETINFLVLLLLLRRLVYRPLREGIERRKQAMAERERAVEQRLEAAREAEAASRAKASEIEALRDQTIREATERAHEESARLLARAREDAGAERARVERLLDAERQAARTWVREMAVEHSTFVAGRLLLELAPGAVEEALFGRLLLELERRREELRGAFSGDGGLELEVTVAKPLSDEHQRSLRAVLERALGVAPRLSIRDDQSLVAGIALRVGDLVYDASLAGELDILRDRARGFVLEDTPLV